LWLKIREDDVRINHERGSIPDPSRYFVKDYPGYYIADYAELTVITPRYSRPVYIYCQRYRSLNNYTYINKCLGSYTPHSTGRKARILDISGEWTSG
jgi:hypothetical protein